MQKVYLDNMSYGLLCDHLAKIVSVLKKHQIVDAVMVYSYATEMEDVVEKDDVVFSMEILVSHRNLNEEAKIIEKIFKISDALYALTGISVNANISLTEQYCELGIYRDVKKGQRINVSEIIYDKTETLKEMKDQIKDNFRFYDEYYEELEIEPPIVYEELLIENNKIDKKIPIIALGLLGVGILANKGVQRIKK